ncbi:MAG: hypothetical protein FWE08_06150 [Oscillospiraceae bacterium]|nr:hypothetical protein [Oscillospiraceae bacterium]
MAKNKKTEATGILIARRPILHLSRQYAPGDELPTDDTAMVEAWVEHKAAAWEKVKPGGKKISSGGAATGDTTESTVSTQTEEDDKEE